MNFEDTEFEYYFSESDSAFVIMVDPRILSSPENTQALVDTLIEIMKTNGFGDRIIVEPRRND